MGIRGTALDLFAGIGGMALAAESVGLRITYAVGISGKEADIYQCNLGQKPYMVVDDTVADTAFETLPETDYVLGNLPYFCYNVVRTRARSASARKRYWEVDYFCDVIRTKMPKGFAVMLYGCRERDMDSLIQKLSQYGYSVWRQAIDSRSATGMPVYDERVYLVGVRKELNICFAFPEMSCSSAYSVSELVHKEEDPGLYIDPSRIAMDPEAAVYNYHYVKERPEERGKKPKYIADRYIRFGAWNPPAVNDGRSIRRISVRELARTKCFPEKFDFGSMGQSAAYEAIGKSVNVSVAAQVIRQLCSSLEGVGEQ